MSEETLGKASLPFKFNGTEVTNLDATACFFARADEAMSGVRRELVLDDQADAEAEGEGEDDEGAEVAGEDAIDGTERCVVVGSSSELAERAADRRGLPRVRRGGWGTRG